MNQQVTGSFTKLGEVTGLDRRTVKKYLDDYAPLSGNDKNDEYDLKQLVEAIRGTDGNKQSNAKKRIEKAKAKLAEIDLAKVEGELIDLEDFIPAWERMIVSFKNNLLVLPHRLAQILSLSESDRKTILEEIYTTLEVLSNYEDKRSSTSNKKPSKSGKTTAKHKRSRVGGKAQESIT